MAQNWLDDLEAQQKPAQPARSWLDDLEDTTASATASASKILGMGGSVLSTVGNVLGIPQQALYAGIDAAQKGEPISLSEMGKRAVAPLTSDAKPITGEDLLDNAGWKDDSWGRWGVGLAADLVADPLNLVGIGAVKKAIGASAPIRAARGASDTVLSNPNVAQALRPYMKTGSKAWREFDYLEGAKKRAAVNKAVHQVAEAAAPAATGPSELARLQTVLETPGAQLPASDPIAQSVAKLRQLADEWHSSEVAEGIMKPEAYRPGYFPKVTKKETAIGLMDEGEAPISRLANPHALERVDDPNVEFVKDPIVAAATRAMRSASLTANTSYLRNAAQKFGTISAEPVEGMRRLKLTVPADLPFAKEVAQFQYPPNIADEIEYVLNNRYKLGATGELFRALNSVWKTYTTTINPAFHATNAVGNVMQMVTLGRMNPAAVPIRINQAKQLMEGKALAAKFGKFSAQEALQQAEKYGITGVEFGQFSNLTTDLTDLLKRQGVDADWRAIDKSKTARVTDALTKNKGVQMAASIGGDIEGHSRLGLFLDGLAKGLTPEESTLLVRKALFDYSELPDEIRRARDVVAPYITWMYKNLPAQTKLLFEAPERAAIAPKIKRSLEGDDPYTEEQMPAFARERGMVDTGAGTAKGAHLLIDPNFPAQDLEVLRGALQGDPTLTLRGLMGQVGPALRIPFELASGKDFRTGRPLWPDTDTVEVKGESLPTSSTKAPDIAALIDRLVGKDLLTTPAMTSSGEIQREMSPTAAYLIRQLPSVLNSVGRVGEGLAELSGGDAFEGFAGAGDTWRGLPLPLVLGAGRMATGMTTVPVTPNQAARNKRFLQQEALATRDKALQTKARQDAAKKR